MDIEKNDKLHSARPQALDYATPEPRPRMHWLPKLTYALLAEILCGVVLPALAVLAAIFVISQWASR